MSLVRVFKYSIKIAAWATPHVQRWIREKNHISNEAERHYQARNYGEASKYLEAALEEAERKRKPLEKRLQLQLRLAESRRRNGDLDGALAAAQDLVAKTTPLGSSHLLYGESLEELAQIQLDRGALDEAHQAAQAALECAHQSKKSSPSLIAQRCHKLAGVKHKLGQTEESKKLLKESISLYESEYGSSHLETSHRLADMGSALAAEGSFAEALPFFERALEAHKNLLGRDAPETLSDIENIARCHHALENIDEALRHYERVIRFREMQIGGDQTAYGKLLAHSADAYLAAGQENRALEHLIQASRMLNGHPDHPTIAHQLASLSEAMGRPQSVAGPAPQRDPRAVSPR